MSILKSASLIGSVIIASLLMTTACNSQKAGQSAGIKPENLDTTAMPQNDFYQFATGGWQKENPLTGEYSRYGSFDKLAENNREQLRGLIEDIASKTAKSGTVEQKIADLFNLAMDSTKLNKDGYEPVKADIAKISALKDSKELVELLPELMQNGV
ncbi:MAG: endothelin-converting enzyme, partial [Bacteroidetes bacterium]|nr:endothelin-converting enzyme [Bacteroidota bacterium]